MDIEKIRKHCLALPHTTEQVQWGADLVFKVDGKMFAVAPLEVAPTCLSFKCSPETFAELCERPGIIPAPYMARAQWVALESPDAIADHELRTLLVESYRLVWERLPKERRETLSGKGSQSVRGTPGGKPARAASGAKKARKRTGGKKHA